MRAFGFSILLCGVVGCGGGEEAPAPQDVAGSTETPWYEQSFPTKPVPITVAEIGNQVVVEAGQLRIEVDRKPWGLRVKELAGGAEILHELSDAGGGPWGRLRFGDHLGYNLPIYFGYFFHVDVKTSWFHAGAVASWKQTGQTVEFVVESNDATGRKLAVKLDDFRERQFTLRASVDPAASANRIGMAFAAHADEGFFGFGERYNAVNQRGNELHCWSEEGSFSLGKFAPATDGTRVPGGPTSTYFPVPFFLSSRGYGIELDTTYRSTFDLAAGRPDAFRFDVESSKTGVVFLLGRNPAETLGMYTELRGRPLVPPNWAFGPWCQMSGQIAGKGDYEIAQEYVKKDIPVSCKQGYMHFFPEGAQLGNESSISQSNAKYHAMGLKSTCYFNPYVGVKHPTLFTEGKQKGYLVKKPDGSGPYVFQYMDFQAAEVDFTNPAAVAWYQAQMKGAVDLGYDGWMYDFGEYTPPDALFFDGRKGTELHNPYPVFYQKAAFDFFQTLDPSPSDPYAPEYVYYVRSGYSGSASVTWAHWTGDPSCDWSVASGLPAQVAAGQSVGLCGVAFSGSDIGGFEWYQTPPPSEELLIRWTEVGCFSGIMRDQTGGLGLGKRTQIFDFPAAIRVWRKYSKLRTALFPYLYTMAHVARGAGLPLMRHPFLHFPQDPKAVNRVYQYMFGDRFLVAPVVEKGKSTQEVYLPAGEAWIDVASAAAYDETDGRWRIGASPILTGGQTVQVAAPPDRCPLFVRAGSILPTLDPSVDTLNAATDPLVTTLSQREHLLHLWVWPDAAGKAKGMSWKGETFAYDASGMTVTGLPQVTVIAQIVRSVKPTAVSVSAQPLPFVSSWKILAGVGPDPSAWSWDEDAGVLWLRLAPGQHQVEIQ